MSEDDTGTRRATVAFTCRDWPGSHFYELTIRLGDREEEVGGSRVFVGPEDALMRAALVLIAGGWEAQAGFPAENGDHTLTFRVFSPPDNADRTRLDHPCELIWSEAGPSPDPIETRSLGAAPSVLELADAVLAFGLARYAGGEPSAALIALSSAPPAVRSARPPF